MDLTKKELQILKDILVTEIAETEELIEKSSDEDDVKELKKYLEEVQTILKKLK